MLNIARNVINLLKNCVYRFVKKLALIVNGSYIVHYHSDRAIIVVQFVNFIHEQSFFRIDVLNFPLINLFKLFKFVSGRVSLALSCSCNGKSVDQIMACLQTGMSVSRAVKKQGKY